MKIVAYGSEPFEVKLLQRGEIQPWTPNIFCTFFFMTMQWGLFIFFIFFDVKSLIG